MIAPHKEPKQPDQDKALELMLSIAIPPGKPAFAERLAQLRDASGVVLDEDSYDRLRREVLDDLVSTSTFPRLVAIVLAVLCLGTTSIALIGWYSGELGLVLDTIRKVHETLHAEGTTRLATAVKIGTRTDKTPTLAGKLF